MTRKQRKTLVYGLFLTTMAAMLYKPLMEEGSQVLITMAAALSIGLPLVYIFHKLRQWADKDDTYTVHVDHASEDGSKTVISIGTVTLKTGIHVTSLLNLSPYQLTVSIKDDRAIIKAADNDIISFLNRVRDNHDS